MLLRQLEGPAHADQGMQGQHGAPGRVCGGCQGDCLNQLLVLDGLGAADVAQGKNLKAINLL